MNDTAWETEQFQRHRPHLEAVAYRMLGSVSEADDALQEAWLRLSRSRQENIHNARAWLTTIVGRVCIDMLRARRARREDPVGGWVPEPIAAADEEADPEQQTLMADTVGLALIVVLETLTPTERVAYVLHDMFAVPFAEIAEIIDRSPEATRQIASRARRRVRTAVPPSDGDLAKQRTVVEGFLAASRSGDFDALVAVLDPGVVLRTGGAREIEQERKGAADVARSFATFGPRFATLCHLATVKGRPGLIVKTGQGAFGAVAFTFSAGLITTIDMAFDLDKLEEIERAGEAGSPHGSPPGGGGVSLLGYLRARPGSVSKRIIGEALSWPGVYRTSGDFGSVVLRFGEQELGHLHGEVVAHVPLPVPLPEDRAPSDSGWVSIALETEEGVRRALELLRDNYERGSAH